MMKRRLYRRIIECNWMRNTTKHKMQKNRLIKLVAKKLLPKQLSKNERLQQEMYEKLEQKQLENLLMKSREVCNKLKDMYLGSPNLVKTMSQLHS